MKKWEELRKDIISVVSDDIDQYGEDNAEEKTTKDVDALIAAVHEDEREKCANYMLWRRDELEEAAGIDPKESEK